jgi:membrane protein DedA with SNARE-associated domain
MESDAPSFLFALGTTPVMVALAIFLATFVLEDVATAGAALLAAEGVIPIPLALTALFAGIFLGDLALFALGHLARSSQRVQTFLGAERLEKGRDWLQKRYVTSLIAARFMPGMRLPTFAASGFLRLPFRTFLLVSIIAAFVWTTIAFTVIFTFGLAAAEALGPWRWAAAALLVLVALAGPHVVSRLQKQGKRTDD